MRKHRSLVLVLMMIVLCATIIVGSTMAYYTDEVPASENLVTSGDLEVKFEWADKLGEGWQDAASAGPIFNQTHWEPNFTTVKYIRVSNPGDMPFQYELNVVPTLVPENGVNLMDVIDVYFGVVDENTPAITAANYADELQKVGNLTALLKNENGAGYGIVLPKDAKGTLPQGAVAYNESVTVCIALHMQHTAGNEYMNRSVGEGFNVQLAATQYTYDDAFGTLFSGGAQLPEVEYATSKTVSVTPDQNGCVPYDIVFESDTGVIAVVPKGARMEQGATQLILIVYPKAKSDANLTLSENEQVKAWEVEVEGLADDNTVPVRFTLPEAMQKGLNIGNYSLYHVENGVSVPMTRVEEITASSAHNSFSYNPATGDMGLALATFSEIAIVSDTTKAWEGKFDNTWYDADATELTIANADQLAAFGAIVGGMDDQTQDSFSGKTVKLISDINLGDTESENNADIIFYPIGYYNSTGSYEKKSGGSVTSSVSSFEGTFDGNGHTISNFYQNTWEMFGDYNDGYSDTPNHYKDAMGLFGYVVNGTIKNLTVDHFSSDGEFTPTGVIAAYAVNSTFENIAITNCNPRVYNTGNGGIVGIGGNSDDPDTYNLTFTNITIDNTNKISALWGSWDVACGGLVGMFRGAGHVYMTNCHVAAQMDVNNDVCGNYQYYWYRYSGMMVGTNKNMITDEAGYTIPETEKFHAEGCTVHFGDWNDYYYCELVANSLASYTHDHQFSRLTEISSLDEIKSGDTWTKAGNFLLISDDTKTCYHIVNKDGTLTQHLHTDAGEETVNGKTVLKEDKQIVYLPFNQLFTGYGYGVKHIPVYNGEDYAFEGITILDRKVADSVEKFDVLHVDNIQLGVPVQLDKLFSSKKDLSDKTEIDAPNIHVTVISSDAEKYPITLDHNRGENDHDWIDDTIILSCTEDIGEGICVKIRIQDYRFCKPTEMEVLLIDRQAEEKFETKFTGDFLYRVGNKNTVALGSLFNEIVDVTEGTVSVTIEPVNGTNASGTYTPNATDWTEGTIQFSGTGVVKVTITDNDYCKPTELYLEVVDAVNATGATSAKSNNIVLLNDVGFSTIEVSNGYALYGNGFKMTASSDIMYDAMGVGFVTLKNGTLDNVQIICPNFSYAIIYNTQIKDSENTPVPSDSSNDARGNVRSAVMADGNSKIVNSYVRGGRAAIFLRSGNLLVDNSTVSGGAAANIHTMSAQSLTLRNVTLIQRPFQATVNDTSKTLMGFSGLFECGDDGNSTPLILEGALIQDAWINEEYEKYVPSAASSIVTNALSKTEYLHDLDGDGTKESLNLGFTYIPQNTGGSTNVNVTDNRTNKDTVPYAAVDVGNALAKATVYSYKKTNGTSEDFVGVGEFVPFAQGSTMPKLTFADTNEDRVFETVFDTSDNRWESTLTVNLDNGDYTFSFDKLLAQKWGTDLKYAVKTAGGEAVDTSKTIKLTASGVNNYVLTITEEKGENNDNATHTAYFILTATKTSIPEPEVADTTGGTPLLVVKSKNSDWSCAIPALEGIKIKYYTSVNNSITLDLATLTPTSTGKQNGTKNYWETTKDGYKLKVTCGYIHDTKQIYGMPVVVNNGGNKMYFTISSTNGYVSTSTSGRTVTLTYEFTDPNGKTLTFTKTWQFNYADYKSGTQYSYSDFVNGTLKVASSGGCVTPDTLVTLANGSKKEIQHVTYEDQLLVWDFYKGEYAAVPASIISNHGYANNKVIVLMFSDGTEVKAVNDHVFMDATLNKMVLIDDVNVQDYVGHSFVKANGDGYTTVELVEYKVTEEYIEAWGILTAGHYNAMVEDMFSIAGSAEEMKAISYFEIGEGMKYDEAVMQADIEKYGLYSYEEFVDCLTEEQFEALGVKYMKISVGKGLITRDYIMELINTYIK